jgi:hypothetical protein
MDVSYWTFFGGKAQDQRLAFRLLIVTEKQMVTGTY